MSTISMKKCLDPSCNFKFPAHYFSDFCSDHSTPQSDQIADKRCALIFEKHGETGLIINVLSSFLPNDESHEA